MPTSTGPDRTAFTRSCTALHCLGSQNCLDFKFVSFLFFDFPPSRRKLVCRHQNRGARTGTPFFLRLATSADPPARRGPDRVFRQDTASVSAPPSAVAAATPPLEAEEVAEADSRMESGVSCPSSRSQELGSGRYSHSRSSFHSPPSFRSSSFTCSPRKKPIGNKVAIFICHSGARSNTLQAREQKR